MSFWQNTSCPFCGDPLTYSHKECELGSPISGEICQICGQVLLGEIGGLCWNCRKTKWNLDHSHFARTYSGRWKLLIQEFKIQKRQHLGRYISQLMSPLIHKNYPLVPVPGNPDNNRNRGFDPVLLITKDLCRLRGNPLWKTFSRRPGKSQKSLNRLDRKSSIKENIYLSEELPILIPESVYLIDDVFTTGATADHCAYLLKSMGVKTIILLAAAGP